MNKPFDPFQRTSLVEDIKLMPNQLADPLGIVAMFASKPLTTTFLELIIDDRGDYISLVSEKARGVAGEKHTTNPRAIKYINIPYFPVNGQVNASDIQNTITNDGITFKKIDYEVAEMLIELRTRLEVTRLFMMYDALKGSIRNDAGEVIIDFYEFLGVTPTTINFDLSNPATNVKDKCLEVSRKIKKGLRGDMMTNKHVLCSKEFFSALTSHPNVEKAYAGYQEASQRLGGDNRSGFTFAGVTFSELDETVQGKTEPIDVIAAGDAHAFPLGTKRTFAVYYAPPYLDGLNRVNQLASEFYAMSVPDPKLNAFVDINAEMDCLPICKNPRVLVKLTA